MLREEEQQRKLLELEVRRIHPTLAKEVQVPTLMSSVRRWQRLPLTTNLKWWSKISALTRKPMKWRPMLPQWWHRMSLRSSNSSSRLRPL
jgi:hypothetical protein